MSEQTNTAQTSAPAAKTASPSEHLIWVDMEMSGLDPETERILEIAIIVTDAHLNTIATAPVWVLHQDDAILDGMVCQFSITIHGLITWVEKVPKFIMPGFCYDG